MISPLVAVASRAALYPIQSIIIIALLVSGAYFHLLDIARNSHDSPIPSGDLYSSTISYAPVESAIRARKHNDEWKWTVDPDPDFKDDVYLLFNGFRTF
jgi:N-terminal domain with HPIH motif